MMEKINGNKKPKITGKSSGSSNSCGSSNVTDTSSSNCNIYSQVKEYILKCPLVSSPDHPAIVGALYGLEQEEKRQLRDVKLRQLFSNSNSTGPVGTTTTTTTTDEAVLVSYEDMKDDYCNDVNFELEAEGDETAIADVARVNINNTTTVSNTISVVQTNGGSSSSSPAHADESDGDWHDVDSRSVLVDDDDIDIDMTKNENINNNNNNNENTDDNNTSNNNNNIVDGTSPLGRLLTPIVVSLVASNNVTVHSPLGAIAIVFHAVLVSPIVRFICTGSPDTDQNSVKGFAAPIRDLPKHQFILPTWEGPVTSSSSSTVSSIIRLRYRKDGVGSIILLTVTATPTSVEGELTPASATSSSSMSFGKNTILSSPERKTTTTTTTIHVTLVANPSNGTNNNNNKNEPPIMLMQFDLDEHFNTLSWSKAISNLKSVSSSSSSSTCTSIVPTLHYKKLSTMISTFVRTFDLGTIYDTDDNNNNNSSGGSNSNNISNTDNVRKTILSNDLEQPYMDRTVQNLPTRQQQVPVNNNNNNSSSRDTFHHPFHIPLRRQLVNKNNNDDNIIQNLFSQNVPFRTAGDFDGDMIPRNLHGMNSIRDLMDPLGILQTPSHMGNLLGPNHPMFNKNNVGGGLHPSPIGMMPPNYQRDPALLGFNGMRARFDPYGPPPTNINNDNDDNDCTGPNDGTMPRGRFGPPGVGSNSGGSINGLQPPGFGPNPDHLRQPKNSNNNMFM